MFAERKTDWGFVIGGIVLLAIGLACLFYPGLTLSVISIIAGVGFLVGGVVNLAAYLRTKGVLKMSGWALLYAVLDIVVGLMFVLDPVATSVVIPWICGLFILPFGCFEIAAAVQLRGSGWQVWGWTLASGVVTVLLGIFFFAAPDTLALLIGLFAVMQGFSLVVYGISVGKLELF